MRNSRASMRKPGAVCRLMRSMPGHERYKILRKAGELMEARVEDLGRTISTEEGKILAEGVFDEADLRFRAAELADFIARAAVHYNFDARRVVAAGFSNGANIAAALLLLHPEALGAAILFRAMVPLVPAPLPTHSGTPVLICNGRRDPLVAPAETERLAALLTQTGASVDEQLLLFRLPTSPGLRLLAEQARACQATARAGGPGVTLHQYPVRGGKQQYLLIVDQMATARLRLPAGRPAEPAIAAAIRHIRTP